MKKTLSIVAGLMLTIFFFAGSQQASAQKYDRVLSTSNSGLRLVVKYAKHWEGESYEQYLKNTDKYGYINDNGKVVVPLIYDDAEPFTESGIAVVKKGKRYGVINTKGATVVPIQYNTVWVTERNGSELGYIILINDKDQRAYATIKGKIILNFNSYDNVSASCERRIEGNTYDFDYMVATKERKGVLSFAIYTFDGKTVIPYITSPKKDGYYRFLIEKDANYVIGMGSSRLNDGDECDIFEMGTGKVLYRNATFNKGFLHNNGKYYLLDNKGKCINGFEFDSISSKEMVGDYIAVYSNGEKKIFNMKTRTISDLFDLITPRTYYTDYTMVYSKGERKVFDTKTNTVYEQFDSILPHRYADNYAVVFSKGEKKIFNLETKTIAENFDELRPYGVLHDRQLNKWILHWVNDKDAHMDTVDRYEIIGTSKTKFLQIPGGNRTYILFSTDSTRVHLTSHITDIHQEFIYKHLVNGRPRVDTIYIFNIQDFQGTGQMVIYSQVNDISYFRGREYDIVEYRSDNDWLVGRLRQEGHDTYYGVLDIPIRMVGALGTDYKPTNGSQQTGQQRRQSGNQQGTPQRRQPGSQQGTPQRNQQGTQQGTQPRRRHR